MLNVIVFIYLAINFIFTVISFAYLTCQCWTFLILIVPVLIVLVLIVSVLKVPWSSFLVLIVPVPLWKEVHVLWANLNVCACQAIGKTVHLRFIFFMQKERKKNFCVLFSVWLPHPYYMKWTRFPRFTCLTLFIRPFFSLLVSQGIHFFFFFLHTKREREKFFLFLLVVNCVKIVFDDHSAL